MTSRIQRLLKIINCLQSGYDTDTAALAEICGVSRRSIFRDLQTLREAGFEFHYVEPERRYSAVVSDALLNAGLTREELLAACLVGYRLVENQAAIPRPLRNASASAAAKMSSRMSGRERERLRKLAKAIAFELDPQQRVDENLQDFETLLEAIAQRRRARIAYEDQATGQLESTLLSPYKIVFRWRCWCVVGRSSRHRQVITVHFARIRNVVLTSETYTIPPRFNVKQHLAAFGHTPMHSKSRHDVVIRFHAEIAPEIAAIRWHHSQRITRNDDGTLDLHLTAVALEEVRDWVLEHGSRAVVLRPQKLRDMIVEECNLIANLYADPPSDDPTDPPQSGTGGEDHD